MKIDVVIPVLNEEQTLEANILYIKTFIRDKVSSDHRVKIIIADNGSTDNTGNIGLNLHQQYPESIEYIRTPKGVGCALKTAWTNSSADIVGYMDLDLATDIQHLTEVVNLMAPGNIDVLYATRLHKKSKVVGRTIKREITSRIFNLILRRYLNVKFSDGMCGFKFLKRPLLSKIMSKGAVSDGWFFCTEILVAAEWLNLSIYELPVTWTDDSNSKVKILKLSIEYMKAMKKMKSKRDLL